jgi:hypothetical protein
MATAFYPCCSLDIREPLILLRDYVDEVIFCDIDVRISARWHGIIADIKQNLPVASLRVGDVRQIVHTLPVINLLFYRRDTTGEGGSGVFVLGDSFLPHILQRFPPKGGLIVTDGSNSRGSNFEKMTRASGLVKHGWKFNKASDQPFETQYGLYIVNVESALNS